MKEEEKNIFGGRFLNISQESRRITEKIDAIEYLDFKGRKELYLYAAAKGKEFKSKSEGKMESFVRDEYYNTDMEYIAMFLALSIKYIKNEGKSLEESLYDKNIIINADGFAETGFTYIKSEIEEKRLDNLEYKKLDELDSLYEKYVGEI